jgi:hypothetical protein
LAPLLLLLLAVLENGGHKIGAWRIGARENVLGSPHTTEEKTNNQL